MGKMNREYIRILTNEYDILLSLKHGNIFTSDKYTRVKRRHIYVSVLCTSNRK